MPCNCRNEDGSLAGRCFGACKVEFIIEQEKKQQRDPMNGFAEFAMAQVDKHLEYKFAQFRADILKEQREINNEEFLKGIKHGIMLAKEFGYE